MRLVGEAPTNDTEEWDASVASIPFKIAVKQASYKTKAKCLREFFAQPKFGGFTEKKSNGPAGRVFKAGTGEMITVYENWTPNYQGKRKVQTQALFEGFLFDRL